MHAEPTRKMLNPISLTASETGATKEEFAGWDITTLPDEVVEKILLNLDANDLATYTRVNHH